MTDSPPSLDQILKSFSDPDHVSQYADGIRRFVPGLDALRRMAGLLLSERLSKHARILVVGAGGGAEIKALADANAGWRFVGIDPANEMLLLAERVLGPLSDRVELIEGYIDDAPEEAFDGAMCLLTLHFLDASERERTVGEIHKRLKPGAPFVAAHCSFPQGSDREVWFDRYAAYAIAMGADTEQVANTRKAVSANLNVFSPEEDERILQAGGFKDVSLFYTAFTWRGWVGYA